MKFRQFLAEEKELNDNFLKRIKDHCSSFVGELTIPIYRGSNNEKLFMFVPKRNDRKPRDSDQDKRFNTTFNLALEHLFKIPLIRTKAIFATRHYSQASNYGSNVGFIFPINGYKLVYGKFVYDSFEDVSYYKKRDADVQDWLETQVDNSTIKAFEDNFKNEPAKIKDFYDYVKEYYGIDYGYTLEKSIKNAELDLKRSTTGEIMILNAGVYFINVEEAAFYTGVKDDISVDYENKVYKALLEKINAL